MTVESSSGHGNSSDERQAGSLRIDIGLAALCALTAGGFLYWAFGYVDLDRPIVLTLTVVFGLFMAFNIGGNDVANSFGTSVGSGTLSIKQALLVAAVFEVSGAVLAGGAVTDTVRDGIVNLDSIAVQPMDLVYIMMSALVAAALWLLYASNRGLPVSTTHSIVGAIVGSSIVLGVLTSGSGSAFALVQWGKVGQIAISWVLSPLLGGIVSFLLYREIKKHVLGYNERAEARLEDIRQEKRAHIREHKQRFERLDELQQISYTHAMTRDMHMIGDRDFDPEDLESDYWREMQTIKRRRDELKPHQALERIVPPIAAIGAAVVGAMLLVKSLGEVGANLGLLDEGLILVLIGVVAWLGTYALARSLRSAELKRATFVLFSWMQVFTAAGFAFSHGSNDIANAIGPFAAVLDVLRTGAVKQSAPVPTVAMVVFGVALCAGLWFIGRNVIRTVGHNLTTIHPASGFAAELSAIGVILMATTLGLPVSSTHILIGAVLGIGLVNRQANWDLMRPIAIAWVVTLPVAAAISAAAFVTLRAAF